MLTERAQTQAIANLLAGISADMPVELFQDPWRAIYESLLHTQPERRQDMLALLARVNPEMANYIGPIIFQKPGQAVINFDNEEWDVAGPKEPPVEWLWPDWLPRRELSMLSAKGGTGKSYVLLDIIRRLINDYPMPDGQPAQRKKPNIIYVDAENYFSGLYQRTLEWRNAGMWPRVNGGLYRMTRPHRDLIDFATARYQDMLIERAYALQPELIAIDSYSASTLKQNNVEDVKAVMSFFLDIAKEYDCVVLIVHHFRKQSLHLDLPPDVDDIKGSGYLVDACRSVMLMHYVKMGEQVNKKTDPRLLKVVKTNTMYPDDLGVWFKPLHPAGVLLEYCDAKKLNSARAESLGQTCDKTDECADWLLEALEEGPLPYREVVTRGEAEGYNQTLIQAARKRLEAEIMDTVGPGKKGNRWQLVAPSDSEEE